MKHLAVLCSLLFAGCVMDAGDGSEQTATEQAEIAASPTPPIEASPAPPISVTPVLAIQATTTTTPAVGSVTSDMIWPLNRSISSVEVVYTQGPQRTGGPTFLAFVVWNGNFVAHIYCSYFGRAGVALQNKITDTLEVRTYGTDLGAITTGSGSGGPVVHPPRPNVDPNGELTFTSSYLSTIKAQGIAALNASLPILQLPGAPIYEPSY